MFGSALWELAQIGTSSSDTRPDYGEAVCTLTSASRRSQATFQEFM